MRTLPILLLAAALGFAGAFLVACGDRNKLLPSGDASAIKSQLDSVSSAVDGQDCVRVKAALAQARQRVDALPSSVDAALRKNLLQGIDDVSGRAAVDCTKTKSEKTTTSETTTTTAPTTTDTTSTTTTSTPTTNTAPTTNTTPTTPTTPTAPPTDTGNSGGTSVPPGQLKKSGKIK